MVYGLHLAVGLLLSVLIHSSPAPPVFSSPSVLKGPVGGLECPTSSLLHGDFI